VTGKGKEEISHTSIWDINSEFFWSNGGKPWYKSDSRDGLPTRTWTSDFQNKKQKCYQLCTDVLFHYLLYSI